MDAEKRQRAGHLPSKLPAAGLVSSRRREVHAHLVHAFFETPAVVHGGEDSDLVAVELDQVRDNPLDGCAWKERRARVRGFQSIQDVACVLPHFAIRGFDHREECQTRFLLDGQDVGHDFPHPEVLVGEGRTNLA